MPGGYEPTRDIHVSVRASVHEAAAAAGASSGGGPRALKVFRTGLPRGPRRAALLNAALAAAARTEEDVQRLRSCTQGFVRICQERPPDWNEQGSALNELFHRLIMEATRNEVLLRLHEGLLRTIKRASAAFGAETMITPLDQWDDSIVKEHRALTDAIAEKDERRARELMRRHLAITSRKLDMFYKTRMESLFPLSS
jgi:DNA-binding FadR family transcriptional regulator